MTLQGERIKQLIEDLEGAEAQLWIAREALIAAREFVAAPHKWRSDVALRLKRSLDLAIHLAEHEPRTETALVD